jgi:cytochrome oxidase Cu insertion factor (SCO1/SenC/PrrC family)
MTARAARPSAASAAGLAARIDATRRLPDAAGTFAAMLAEESPLFAGRGTNEAERLRGYILASFETAGLAPGAVPFVLEELETGDNSYTVAAAARALRGASEVPAEAPALLVRAIARLRDADDVVSFERFEPVAASGNAVTALAELARTLAFLGRSAKPALEDLKALLSSEGETFSPAIRGELVTAVEALARADDSAPTCCCAEDGAEPVAPRIPAPFASAARKDLADLALENQDGVQLSFSEAFAGRPTALAFFYTRCMNPEKCSLTVTRLARLARRLAAEELDANVAGISYDPGFDRPARLKTYGADRGMIFSPRCRLLRTIGPFDPLKEAFDLGVGFGPVTVNRHRLDLVVLDASLEVAERFERRLWQEETVVDALRGAFSAL